MGRIFDIRDPPGPLCGPESGRDLCESDMSLCACRAVIGWRRMARRVRLETLRFRDVMAFAI
jgi:hypothetical protein